MAEIKKLINTLTVKELKNLLDKVDENTEIYVDVETDCPSNVEIEIFFNSKYADDFVFINLIK